MKNYIICYLRTTFIVAIFALSILSRSAPAMAGEYAALINVKGIKTVFDVSVGSPQKANVVFWAVRNVYDDANTRVLPEKTVVVVVFRGPAVKMLSTDRSGFSDKDKDALDEFAGMIKQMKVEGVRFEVCGYALRMMGVDPATVLPEVNQVGNGFISIAGYQAKGFSVITIN